MKVPRGVIVCIGLALVSAVLCVVGIVRLDGTGDVVDDFPAVAAGSSDELQLEEGEQVGYYESTCFGCQGRESTSVAPRLRIFEPADALVDVATYGDERTAKYSPGEFLNYSHGDFDGGPAYSFDLPSSATYTVEVGPSAEPGAQIRIGPSIAERKVVGLVLAIAGFVIAGIAVLVLAAWGVSVMLYQATRDG